MHYTKVFISFITVVCFLCPLTRADEFDVSPRVENNQIVTNAYNDGYDLEIDNVRVFAYEFGEIPGQPYFLPDPGFHPLTGSGFAGGSSIGFSVVSALSFWDGAGAVMFSSVPGAETLRLARGSSAVTVGDTAPVPGGFNIGTVDANGEFDEHLDSFLERAGGLDPTEGIYLLSMTLHTSAAGIMDSPAIYLLYNNGLDEELLDDARVYVRDTFAPGTNLPEIPEPTALGVIMLAAAPLVVRRRRLSR